MTDNNKVGVETIDLTPTWSALLPVMFEVLEHGTPKSRDEIRGELRRMAQIADLYVASRKQVG